MKVDLSKTSWKEIQKLKRGTRKAGRPIKYKTDKEREEASRLQRQAYYRRTYKKKK